MSIEIEQKFLDEIRASPADVAPKLIFADWLEEKGDPRGELIRAIVVEELEAAVAIAEITLRDDFEETFRGAALPPSDWPRFAADCAEHVLHYYASRYPSDQRPRDAIAAARGVGDPVARETAVHNASIEAHFDSKPAEAAHAVCAAHHAVRAMLRGELTEVAQAADSAVAATHAAGQAGEAERHWQLFRLCEYKVFGGALASLHASEVEE